MSQQTRIPTSMGCLFLLGVFLIVQASAQSGEKEPPVKNDTAERSETLELIETAHNVAAYGRKTKSPEALIAAAGMLKQLPPVKGLPADPASKQEGDTIPSFQDEAEALLAEAKTMSKNDPTVVALADAVANRKVSRAVPPGGGVPGKSIVLKSGESREVTVAGKAGRPLQVVLRVMNPLAPVGIRIKNQSNAPGNPPVGGGGSPPNPSPTGLINTAYGFSLQPASLKGTAKVSILVTNPGKTPAGVMIFSN